MSSLLEKNARKQAEERNLRLLRELAAQSHNKQCLDCYQRGPTYVNMTIGSFVCTRCSGLLRGLNPPHRVKSISMATFTPAEIEFLKARGNEYCRGVWTGRYGLDGSISKDETQMKDYLIMKYEKKLWYINPDETTVKKLTCKNLNLSPPDSPIAVLSRSPNLFVRHGDVVKTKSSSTANSNSTSSANLNILFDPFDHFQPANINQRSVVQPPVLPKSATMPSGLNEDTAMKSTGKGAGQENNKKSVDKYAALAELDEMFHTVSTSGNGDYSKADSKSSTSSAMHPSAFIGFYPPTGGCNNYYATAAYPYHHSSYIVGRSSNGVNVNPFYPPGALHNASQRWAYGAPMTGTPGAGYPLAAHYAQSLVNTGMNPFMSSTAMQHAASPRNPFL